MKKLRIFLLLLVASAAPAKTYVLGAYTIEAERLNLADGGETLHIRYSPYEVYQHAAWQEARYHHAVDPLGPRPYWDLPLASLLPLWSDNPDLASTGVFDLELTSGGDDHWDRLLLADRLVQTFLMEKEIGPFLRDHEAELNALEGRLAREIGKPIFFAQFSQASQTKRNQYLLSEGLKFLHDHSVLFTREEIDASKTLPRLPKLSRSPAPITQPSLLVVHATTEFDAQTAKGGIDRAIADFKAKRLPVVFLMNDSGDGDTGWYTADREPSYAVFSAGGEHNLDLRYPEVTVTGGFFGDADSTHGCQFKAMVDTISRYFLHGDGPLRLHLPLSAIYFYDDDRGAVEAFLAGRTKPEAFFKDTVEGLFFNEDPTYLGMQSFSMGNPSTQDYTFEFYFEGKPVITRGSGPRHVRFLFSR